MSLTTAFSTASTSLLNTAAQLSASSRNIDGASNTSYSRKIAVTVTNADGSTRINVVRASDLALFNRMKDATSTSAKQTALLAGLTTLQTTVGDTDNETSVAGKLGTFNTALASYTNSPDDPILAQAAVTAAQDLATSLNTASNVVQGARKDADAAIATSVSDVNDLLKQFETANNAVVSATVKGDDLSDVLDARDAILSKLSEEMGISTVTRGNNDMVIYTDSGVTMFDKSPRKVSFEASTVYDGTVTGNAVFVDGVAVTGASATMPLKSGSIAGNAELRDTVAVTYQNQLDEIARSLISEFAEKDQVSTGADKSGLFTNGTDSTIPSSLTKGLAAHISINSAAVVSEGGSALTLRDGGMNGTNYVYNTAGTASFNTRLTGISSALSGSATFDSSTQLGTGISLATFASSSVSWLEGLRSATSTAADTQKTFLSQASTALSNATGVNTDQEYAKQLELENAYQASSKLISLIQSMYDSLFSMIK